MPTSLQEVQPAESINELIERTTVALAAAGVGTPRLDAELLLAAASGLQRTALYARGGEPASVESDRTLPALLARRVAREPLQYIVGKQEFWSLDFLVNSDVLIPRPETELLVELTLGILRGKVVPIDQLARTSPRQSKGRHSERSEESRGDSRRRVGAEILRFAQDDSDRDAFEESRHPRSKEDLAVCDMGTGSGCIAVALARELPHAQIWAVDASPAALVVAEVNARSHGVAERVHCVASDLFASLAGRRFDVIVSNPPYVSSAEMTSLQPEVLYEPRRALEGGVHGLDVIARLLMTAPAHLTEGGWLIMEIGADQETAVSARAAAHFAEAAVRRDYAGHPRVLVARR